MLKGVDLILNPDTLWALASMGHGDEIVVVDAWYPAESTARQTGLGKLLRVDGDSARVMRALLSVMTLDSSSDEPAFRMAMDDDVDLLPHVQVEAEAELKRAQSSNAKFAQISREDFYERARKSWCVIATSETRSWGNFILRSGFVPAPDAPAEKTLKISKESLLPGPGEPGGPGSDYI